MRQYASDSGDGFHKSKTKYVNWPSLISSLVDVTWKESQSFCGIVNTDVVSNPMCQRTQSCFNSSVGVKIRWDSYPSIPKTTDTQSKRESHRSIGVTTRRSSVSTCTLNIGQGRFLSLENAKAIPQLETTNVMTLSHSYRFSFYMAGMNFHPRGRFSSIELMNFHPWVSE